ncbi:type II toxin-antitoxin system HigB family toxin [Microcoleus sp.]|uniref:type II toxin-antitoxin system HigB family toxin n=1 Tax=Microcoleus sp. TaxID=44472 RepID=UPI0035934CEF
MPRVVFPEPETPITITIIFFRFFPAYNPIKLWLTKNIYRDCWCYRCERYQRFCTGADRFCKDYRLIAGINYENQTVFYKYFLTHGEYDKDKWKNDPYF